VRFDQRPERPGWFLVQGAGFDVTLHTQVDEENLAELTQLAADFQGKALPGLRGLQLA